MTTETISETETRTDIDLDFPSLWGVKFVNDDYTPMDFVVAILVQNFNQSEQDAFEVMIAVHEEGHAIVGAYTKDIAITKATQSEYRARQSGHPLRLEAVSI